MKIKLFMMASPIDTFVHEDKVTLVLTPKKYIRIKCNLIKGRKQIEQMEPKQPKMKIR